MVHLLLFGHGLQAQLDSRLLRRRRRGNKQHPRAANLDFRRPLFHSRTLASVPHGWMVVLSGNRALQSTEIFFSLRRTPAALDGILSITALLMT